jgi:hypothetical protein
MRMIKFSRLGHCRSLFGSDGVTLCREPPAALNEGEIVVASNEERMRSPVTSGSNWAKDYNTLSVSLPI